jgi:hypothetical protein
MPKNSFKLSEHSDQMVHIKWRGIWKDVQVSLDDVLLLEIPNQRALKAGQNCLLPDGSTLEVRLKTGMQTELQVMRDGTPLPGSGGDPAVKLKLAQGIIYFIGGLTLLLALVAEFGQVEFLARLGIDIWSAIDGALFLILGFFVGKRSQVALGLAIALYIGGAAMSIWAGMEAGGRMPTSGLVVRVLFLIPMFQGFGAIKALKASAKTQVKVEAF